MDNLAHTLVGATLGRAVAGHRVPRAALLGAVAGNAPDWIELLLAPAVPRSAATYLVGHRGITHSFLGAGVEIGALTAVVALGAAWWIRRRGIAAPSWPWIALCIAMAVLSHLYMDWQGSYGLRPFLPWSERWYYADWVAIVDPFFWLVPLVGLAWGAPRHWRPGSLVAAGALPTLILVLLIGAIPGWVKLVFGLGAVLGITGWIHHWFGVAARRRAAAYSAAVLVAYAGLQGAVSVPVKADIAGTARARFGPSAEWAALTVPGRPFFWEPVYANRDTVAGDDWQVPRHLELPIVQRALRETADGNAMARFARFLVAEVDSGGAGDGSGGTVYLRDARYERVARQGWGVVTVRIGGGRRGDTTKTSPRSAGPRSPRRAGRSSCGAGRGCGGPGPRGARRRAARPPRRARAAVDPRCGGRGRGAGRVATGARRSRAARRSRGPAGATSRKKGAGHELQKAMARWVVGLAAGVC